jgi:hypothetical protein
VRRKNTGKYDGGNKKSYFITFCFKGRVHVIGRGERACIRVYFTRSAPKIATAFWGIIDLVHGCHVDNVLEV